MYLLNPNHGKTIISLYNKEPKETTMNPINWIYEKSSYPIIMLKIQTITGYVNYITFLVNEDTYLVILT